MKSQAARISLLISSLVTLLFSIFLLYTGTTHIVALLLIFFSINFILTYFIIENIIYKKIRSIYTTIRSLKLAPAKRNKSGNILNDLSEEVLEWEKIKKEEIDYLKSIETYRKDFIGNVSHELKTPIFNIQGYISTLLDGGLEDPRINRDYLARAEKSVDRMITIIEDLEIITRLEAGQLNLEMETFNIVDLVREIIDQEEMKAQAAQIKVSILIPQDKIILVKADRERIRQVLTNLIVNSLKYGKSGGHTQVNFFEKEKKVFTEINDDGIGISENHLPRLFERFYRVDKSRSREQGGSGLGLAIVKHIIEAHGETISVKSTQGVGSAFTFSLEKG